MRGMKTFGLLGAVIALLASLVAIGTQIGAWPHTLGGARPFLLQLRNMVADAIGRGKSLLVICQKQPAIDVVRKRLERERLGDRFVMITDATRDREAIVGSIRSQVEALHSRPAGGSPAWRRDRERLAARIDVLEAELDRQQGALHEVENRTGLTYRSLLGELLAIEENEPKPIDAPALRSLLSDLHPSDIATVEENCGPLARYWLPAKFEGKERALLCSSATARRTSAIRRRSLL
jgi:primosomal replication protein N''